MHNKGIWVLIFLAIIIGIAFWSVGGYRVTDEAQYYLKKVIKETATIQIHNSTFNTEVARTQKAREKGLRNRKSLSGDRGMLFVFDQADIYSFTMVDTLIPLDIIWILDNRIVEIKQQAEPGESLITPTSEANYVLEIRGGSAESLDINTGSTVDITFDKNDES